MKNHFKKIIGDAFKAFGCLIVACFIGYFISNGVFGLIASLMSSNKLVVRFFNFIPFFLIVVVALFSVSYREEYRREQFSLIERCISATLACGGQLLFAIIVTYAVYTCGPALSLAQIIYTKNDINVLINDNDVPNYLYIICMLILDVFYVVGYVWGGYVGQKKREKDRVLLLKK